MSQNELKKLCVYDENQDAEVMYIMDTRIAIYDEEIYDCLLYTSPSPRD